MQVLLLLQLLILLVVANGAAVAAKKLLRGTLARPLDGGALFLMAALYSGRRKPFVGSSCPCWQQLSARRSWGLGGTLEF